MSSSFPELGDGLEAIGAAASYRFDAEQFGRAVSFGTPVEVQAGDVIFEAGDDDPDLILIESAIIDIIRTATPDAPEQFFIRSGPGQFVGEVNLLTGQTRILSARVVDSVFNDPAATE